MGILSGWFEFLKWIDGMVDLLVTVANLSREERQPVHTLWGNADLMVPTVDMGIAVIVLDTNNCIWKI
jgi:hypothetical protein